MGLQDLFNWREKTTQSTASMPAVADEDLVADVDEPPDYTLEKQYEGFHKASIQSDATIRKKSLLTQALHIQESIQAKPTVPEICVATDISRRRSMLSNASIASTAELTSDGGLTSPARTNTPSPPFPSTTYSSFGHYSLGNVPNTSISNAPANIDIKDSIPMLPEAIGISPKAQAPIVPVVPQKRRCISFACGGRKDPVKQPAPTVAVPQPVQPTTVASKCKVKFACPAKPTEKVTKPELSKSPEVKPEVTKKGGSRSPSVPRRSPRAGLSRPYGTRRSSQSPVAVRCKPKYIVADETSLSSEATRFHEFASGVVLDDDWIRRELEHPEKKLTISDTLQKENAIRKLGKEAEAELLEEDEDAEEDEEEDENDIDENDSDEETGSEIDDLDRDSLDGSESEGSDGNETDNEAGFADSDDESDDGEFAFWTPGRTIASRGTSDAIPYRASANDRSAPSRPSNERIMSASSIDSLITTSPQREEIRRTRRKHIKIRPGTPDLPDSTDFVCGTLDEDRPLEQAYVSCIAARNNAKHKQTPQDIDPSFPTSDMDDEEDEEEALVSDHGSDEDVWLHGKFEYSDDERPGRRRSTVIQRKSPGPSPKRMRSPAPAKRLHSPPPAKARLRSPPPRKLFGASPRRMRSPPPARGIRSPAASPTFHTTSTAIAFAPLGTRPGLTHTKSLPRSPSRFCREYRALRLQAANGEYRDDSNDLHMRGAIDIVKGLEQKRERRKEKHYKNHPRKKGHMKKPQPGKGAERMRELGLLMAGKTDAHDDDPYMLSA